MRTWMIWIAVFLLLTGCSTQETFETVDDDPVEPVSVQLRQTTMELPSDAASPTVESESGRIYLCDGYEISVQTFHAGDLDATVRSISGYSREDLTVMQTASDGIERYEFVWASAGEHGDRVGRAVVLDDGAYHYVLMVLGDSETAYENLPVWQRMFKTFRLV